MNLKLKEALIFFAISILSFLLMNETVFSLLSVVFKVLFFIFGVLFLIFGIIQIKNYFEEK